MKQKPLRNEVCAGIILYRNINETIEFLLLQAKDKYYNLAKGHVEQGETHRQAALRETHEETSITLRKQQLDASFTITTAFTHEFSTYIAQKTVYFFLAQVDSTTQAHVNHEHKSCVWMPAQQALQEISPRYKQVLQQAYEHIIKYK